MFFITQVSISMVVILDYALDPRTICLIEEFMKIL
jgi:hypothetical protein